MKQFQIRFKYFDNTIIYILNVIAINPLSADENEKIILIGVSYALLDLCEKNYFDLSNWTIMETGGMKGRRKELTREENNNGRTVKRKQQAKKKQRK